MCMLRCALLMLLALALAGPAPAATPRVIVLVGAIDTKESLHGPWLEQIYREAFRRLGYGFEYLAVPTKRASVLSDQGQVDGEIHRVADYGSAHPNLVRVEEPHFAMTFAAYAKGQLHLNGWSSLKGSQYRVEYRAGVKRCESELPSLIPPERLAAAPSALLGLRKLALDRSDVFIDVEDVVEANLAGTEFKGTPIHKAGVLEQVAVHAFLHKKNAALAPKLAATLAAMKREGLIEQYRQRAIARRVVAGEPSAP